MDYVIPHLTLTGRHKGNGMLKIRQRGER